MKHIPHPSPRHTARGLIGAALVCVWALLLCSCGAEQNVKKGDAFFAIGEYFDAAAEYKKAYSRTPSKEKDKRGERAWKMAESYRRINYAAKAAAGYQNAVRYNYPDSMALFYLAKMQHTQGEYKNAEKNYRLFLDSVPDHELARNGLRGVLSAPRWKESPTLYTIRKQAELNARRADFSPVLTGDAFDELYFTSTRPQATGDEISGITGTKSADIFRTKLDDKQKWTAPEPCEGEVNSQYEEGACCFSPDGKTMYLTRCTHDPDYPRYAEIFTSQRSDASWSKPVKLDISADTLSSFAHPAVSPDGNWLYFVSDMPGGLGGLDIWRIAIGNGLGGVENLGEPINTPGNEMFPTFRPNGDLYFSSDGHPGMGGLDLFCAQRDTTNKKTERWKIENLKFPMNSAGDDFGMTFEGVHNRGYFCSNRGDGRGWDHLYSFECPEILQTIKGWVYEKDGYELPEGLVYLVGNDGTNKKVSVRGDGSFVEVIKPHVKYILLGTCKGYLNHKEELEVDTVHESREYTLQFPLASLNTPVLVRNVFYEFDSANLTELSTMALDSLVDLLNENPNITIELSAHCDYRGADAYNERLSQRRAESVVNYLIAHGIAKDRLQPVGYGESRPKVVTRKMAEQNAFLNVGDTLTEAFILRFDDKDIQEKCNAYNRRTEFRVLRTTYGMFDAEEEKASPFEGEEAKPLIRKDEATEAKDEATEAKDKTAEATDKAVKAKKETAKSEDETAKAVDEAAREEQKAKNDKTKQQ